MKTWELTFERRFNAKCKCGAVRSSLATIHQVTTDNEHHEFYLRKTTTTQKTVAVEGAGARAGNYGGVIVACPCGRTVYPQPVKGTLREDKPCDLRCTSARGHNCECSCGGKNHGADHQAA